MSTRLLAVVLGLAALAFGCDSGSDSESGSGPGTTLVPPTAGRELEPAPPVDEFPVEDYLPEVVDMCRGVYDRLPVDDRAATTEDAFVVECLAALSTRPDPVRSGPS